jgi:F-box protein 31
MTPQYPHVFAALRPVQAFCIEVNPANEFVVQCFSSVSAFQEPITPHSCDIYLAPPNEFRTKCLAPYNHQTSSVSLAVEEETGPNPEDDYRVATQQKFSHILSYLYDYSYSRIEWPMPMTGAVIQPGLFKGDFGPSGLEFVMLTYEEGGAKVKAIKITGDPNIPVDQVAFEVNLSEVVNLSAEQQSPIELLRVVNVMPSPPPLDQLLPQPFAMPEGVIDCITQTPNYCKARFYGLAQIAYEGYIDPIFVNGHWVIFDENAFGFLYFELSSFSIFHRVQEKLI